MDIRPLASSSAGNCYLLSDGSTALLLEAGIPLKKIREGIGFRLSEIAGCLVSHEHADHAKAAADVMKAGVDVYASRGTVESLGLSGHRVHPVRSREQFRLGTWNVLPFEVEHDAAEPLGFLLASESGEKLLYATDTYYIRYRFLGLTHIAIECNFSIEILNQNIMEGRVPAAMKPRLLRSHFSLEHVKEFLLANDLSRVQEIWLLHLSDTNSDADLFKREIQELTGKQVFIAEK